MSTRNGRYAVSLLVLFAGVALTTIVEQKNGAPVWLSRAAACDKNLLDWLDAKGIQPPTVDAIV